MSYSHCNSHQSTLAERLARFHRISWREALGGLAGPARRLHEYRELRTRVIATALDQRICCKNLLPRREPSPDVGDSGDR